jgi:hypothetical protein
MANVKFLKKGIKIDGKYFPVWYSTGKLINHPEGTITIYARSYDRFPAFGMEVENGTDIQTDYFEKDKVRVEPSHPLYPVVAKAAGVMAVRS